MIGLDTNILVRYLTKDDPIQSPKAAEILRKLTDQNPGFVSVVVLAETAWVLESVYGFSQNAIATALTAMIQAHGLLVQDDASVIVALRAAEEGGGSFADALIGALASRMGCERILTFDRRAARLPGFELL